MKEMNFARKWLTLLQKTYILKVVYNEVGQDVIIEKHEIQIDQITSGKVNIFTFYRNRKQIDDHSYDCKNHRLQQATSSIFILMQRLASTAGRVSRRISVRR